MIQKWFDEYTVGERSVTRGRTITEADVVQFAMLSGDWNPLHTDETFASQAKFGRRIAHGMLLLAVATGLTPIESPYILAFYGMDRVRFLSATFLGDTVRVESELIERTERDEASGVLTFLVRIVNQKDEPAVVYHMKLLVARAAVLTESTGTN